MPRKAEPKATDHNGYLRVRWKGEEYSLGPYDSPESWRRFEALKADLLAGPAGGLTIADLVKQYWTHVKVYYRLPNGEPTSEVRANLAALDRLLAAHKNDLASAFGPAQLKAHRQQLVEASLSRKTINQEVGRIVRMFKWAAGEELLAAEVWHRLAAVGGLKAGRSEAPDRPKVQAVELAAVEATVPFLSPPLQAAVWLQRYSACRPDEALRLRPCDVDRSGPVWVYSPTCPDTGEPRHKTAWAGKPKLIFVGPALQRILAPWLDGTPPAEYCFSPAKQFVHHLAARSASRRTKRTPSEQAKLGRRKASPKKAWGPRYTESSYANAIEAAVAKANLARACDACKALGDPEPCAACRRPEREGLKGPRVYSKRCRACRDRTRLWCEACRAQVVPHWHPNQLRHFRLQELERRHGIRDAQRVAGHSSPSTTEIYLAEDKERLYAIALQDG